MSRQQVVDSAREQVMQMRRELELLVKTLEFGQMHTPDGQEAQKVVFNATVEVRKQLRNLDYAVAGLMGQVMFESKSQDKR